MPDDDYESPIEDCRRCLDCEAMIDRGYICVECAGELQRSRA